MKKIFLVSWFNTFIFLLLGGAVWAVDCTVELPTSVSATDINQCIDNASNVGGGEILFASGTFNIDETIVLKSNVTLRGQGKTSTIIQYSGSSTSDDIISNKGDVVTDVTVRDLTVRGSGQYTGDNQIGIVIKDDNGGENYQITIREVEVEKCGQYGIHIKGTDGLHITYSTIRYNGSDHELDHNIYLRRIKNAKLELSTSNYAAGNGLNVAESENVVVRNFKAKYNGQNGIRFSNSDYVEINSVNASHNGYDSKGDTDPCDEAGNRINDDLCNGIELRTEDDGNAATYDGVDYACVMHSTSNNNYSFWLYIHSSTHYELDSNNPRSGNGGVGNANCSNGNEKCVTAVSTSAKNVCSSIPNSVNWPFDGSTDAEYTSATIAAFEGADGDDDGYDSSDGDGDDCDDTADTIYPGATETCDDGIDQDCDGIDFSCADVDYDGDGYSVNQGDCDESTNARNPGVAEICGDGIDQNCDGVDSVCDSDGDGLTDLEEASYGTDPNDADTDNDYLSDYAEVHNGTDPLVYTDWQSPIINILLDSDDDSDGADSIADGGDDCDDTNASIYVGAAEVCGDGVDQNCDGVDTYCDTDVDGVTDNLDLCPSTTSRSSDDVVNADGCALSQLDSDSDGLNDYDEVTYGTDAHDSDTDNDGIFDGDEVANNYDPLNVDYVVSKTADTNDGVCNADCSFREALRAANLSNSTTAVAIRFDIPSSDSGCDASGVCTLAISSAYPALTRNYLTIDGASQSGAIENSFAFPSGLNTNLKIVLNGSALTGTVHGLVINGSFDVVKGVVISGFPNNGIYLGTTANNAQISGCFIGTDVAGTSAIGNKGVGIYNAGTNTVIGTNGDGVDDVAERNLISGNAKNGVQINNGTGNIIAGNLVGVDINGVNALPNLANGLSLLKGSNRAGSNNDGVSDDNEGNIVGYNAAQGIQVNTINAIGNVISRNSVFNNTAFGIILGGGANNNKAYPKILSDVVGSSTVTISGKATAGDTVELFIASTDNEGKTYLGNILADSSGNWTVTSTPTLLPLGTKVVATATDTTNGTSVFSAVYTIK